MSPRLRPTAKILPEHARAHNRSLVLQHLFHAGPTSRADLARATALTRVTVSDLVSGLMNEDLVEELGVRPGQRVGKPAILVGLRANSYQIVSVDLTDDAMMRGAVITLFGEFVARKKLAINGRQGVELVDLITRFVRSLIAEATAAVIGVGIGSPGVINELGMVVEAPNRGWFNIALADELRERLGLAVHVANDANTAALGEFTFGGASGAGLLVVTVGEGVGAGIMVDGVRVLGHSHAAGEIGHLTVLDDGSDCVCGRQGCLETLLAAPALRTALANAELAHHEAILTAVGQHLGRVLAPIVGALNLEEVLLSGPVDLLDGALRTAAEGAIRSRTMPSTAHHFTLRMASLGDDVVLAGAAVLVMSGQLGIS